MSHTDTAGEYESAAEWCAAHELRGAIGDRLPPNLSREVWMEISENPEHFQERVRLYAYARAMERRIP